MAASFFFIICITVCPWASFNLCTVCVCVCVKQCRKQGSTEVAKENFHIGKSEQLGESGQMFSQFFKLIAGYLLSYMHKGPQ